jgi:4-hydroxythreonine-4-phosphate dehydrogenase
MNATLTTSTPRPVVALTLGDPAGIGPELIAKLLTKADVCNQANIVLVGDPWLWNQGQEVAGQTVAVQTVSQLSEVRHRSQQDQPAFLAVNTVRSQDVQRGVAAAAGGQSVLQVLDLCMDATLAGDIDAICFAPLNKQAMKIGGMQHEDELHHFAA